MASSIILNTSIINVFRSSQRDLFCKVDMRIDITNKLKIPVKEFIFSKAVGRRPATLLKRTLS